MNEDTFVLRNRDNWMRLDAYNARLNKKGIKTLSPDEIRDFTELSRVASHHLAYARTHFSGSKTAAYLNRLTGDSHNYFYTREKLGAGQIISYFRSGFPARVREDYKAFFISAAVFLLSAIGVYVLCLLDSSLLRFFVSVNAAPSTDGIGEAWLYPFLSAFVITNNIKVAVTAFAFGFFAGLGTLYVLMANGGIIGAYVLMAQAAGLDMLEFASLILPHGVIELTAVFLSAAAGLTLGRAILAPGQLRRRDALTAACKRAVYTIPGVALMLLIAGIIEGFFTPLDIHPGFKLTFAALTLVLTVVYFTRCGRPIENCQKGSRVNEASPGFQ